MSENSDAIVRMRAVTMSREYGSGGGEIAARLAQRLGWQLIDHDIVERVALEMGVSEEVVEAHDEQTEGLFARILNSMQGVDPALMASASQSILSTDAVAYRNALTKVVEAAVSNGHVVIVGRASQVLLGQHRDVFHIRVVAPLEMRVAYVMNREGLDQVEARSRIQLKDKDRARYLQMEFHQHSDDAHLYDIVINTAVIDLDGAVDIACLALQHKAERLAVPSGELGPVVGLPRYPGHPEDFRPPER
jgi:cytidylate kinase